MLSRTKIKIIPVVSIFIVTFLLLFMLRATQQTGDSLSYALSAKTGQRMFHPHHLLFTPIIYLSYSAITLICKSCDVIFAAQLHNIILATVVILSFYVILKDVIVFSSFFSTLLTILLLISRGILVFSTQIEVYIPATACLTLFVLIMTTRLMSNKFDNAKVIALLLLLTMAIFYHQTNVLFCIPFSYYFIATQNKQRYKSLIIILSLSGIIVLLAYILAFFSIDENRTAANFLRFCLSYSFYPDPNWGSLEHFSLLGIKKLLKSQLWNVVELPRRFRYIAVSFLIILFIWNLVKASKPATYHNKFRRFLLIWIMTYFIFFLWWLPGEKEFFITTLVPIMLLFALSIKDLLGKEKKLRFLNKLIPVVLILFIAFISAKNGKNALALHQTQGTDYRNAWRMAKLIPEECVILTDWTTRNHLQYFFEREKVLDADLLLFFYNNESLPEYYHLKEEKCVVVALSYVTPDYDIAKYNGYTCPSKWIEYMKWLFDFKYNSEQRRATCRKFELLHDDNGTLYVYLSSSTVEIENFNKVFEALDGKINMYFGKQINPFGNWLAKNPRAENLILP